VSKEGLTRRHTHSQDNDFTTVQGRRMRAPGKGGGGAPWITRLWNSSKICEGSWLVIRVVGQQTIPKVGRGGEGW
jgi:hypothetical protein